jgi:hypothetical protein
MTKKIIGKRTLNRIMRCEGPLELNCKMCDDFDACMKHWLNYYSRIPHFIIEKYVSQLSPSAFKIFMYLNRKANFERESRHYGRCWLTYETIEKATGVKASNMRKYMRELQDLKLIKCGFTHHKNADGTFSTVHDISVTWYKRLEELGIFKKLR